MVVAPPTGRVVVDQVLLPLDGGSQTAVVVSDRSKVEVQGLEGVVAAAMDEAVGLGAPVEEDPHVRERLNQVYVASVCVASVLDTSSSVWVAASAQQGAVFRKAR